MPIHGLWALNGRLHPTSYWLSTVQHQVAGGERYGEEPLRRDEAAHHFVAVVYGEDELLEIPPCVRLWQATRSGNQLIQIPTRCILHCNCEMIIGEEHLQPCASW